jgi:hypothetical protein
VCLTWPPECVKVLDLVPEWHHSPHENDLLRAGTVYAGLPCCVHQTALLALCIGWLPSAFRTLVERRHLCLPLPALSCHTS